jgi:hypothetical protein
VVEAASPDERLDVSFIGAEKFLTVAPNSTIGKPS